ncbi:MAG: carbon-nitrogen hydrolase family protein [Lentisphaerae bacterium]|nr:carbon-nitrogen hydrolase family protein [Lentisphaerota bacterium]
MRIVLAFVLAGLPLSAQPTTQATVRVAALQCCSPMGRVDANISNLVRMVRQAAADGARIVVTPECAVQGYMDATTLTGWTSDTNSPRFVGRIAQPIPGPASRQFTELARELGVYVCVGLIESSDGKYFNSQVLLAPDGSVAAHHRKKALWTPGDAAWCTPGDRPVQVVDSPFGRLGLMICFDFHALPGPLAERHADIVLYSVGWYGPNERSWFTLQFPRRVVIPHGFAVVAANWSAAQEDETWPGRGHSCILRADGTVAGLARGVVGSEIVIADLPVRRSAPPSTRTSP